MPFYPAGQTITLSTTVRTAAGALADPGDISFELKLLDGTPTVYDYSPGPIVRDDVGQFHLDLAAPAAGHYQGRWITTGANAGASEDVFDVLVSFYPALCSLADVKSTLQIIDTQFDDELRRYIALATSLVEHEIGGPVVDRTVTEAPVYAGNGPLRLTTAHPISITSITSIPYGITTDVTTTWLDSAGLIWLKAGYFTAGPYSVVLKAGLGSVPPGVSMAAQVIVQGIWETQRAPSLAPGVPSGIETPQPFLNANVIPPAAKQLLAPYAVSYGFA